MQTIQNTNDLLAYLITLADAPDQKNWFGYKQQRITGINLAYQIAINHADTMTPEQVADYVVRLNNSIYTKIIKG